MYRPEVEDKSFDTAVLDIIGAGLKAADPVERVEKSLRVRDGCVTVNEKSYCGFTRVYIAGFGKASRGMAQGALSSLGDMVEKGMIIVPKGSSTAGLPGVTVLEGEHPVPGELTVSSSLKLLGFLRGIPKDALVVLLISGGGSALFEVPAEGVSIRDVGVTASLLMKRGANIIELNTVRKHLSRVKGGQLLRYIPARKTIALIISDVVGDRIDSIASGPTAPDPTTFQDAHRILVKYNVWSEIPESVRNHIEKGLKGLVPETVKPGDPILEKADNYVVASNIISLRAMAQKALKQGWKPVILSSRLRGEAREAAKVIAGVIESIYFDREPVKPPVALIAGGETTVTVRGDGVGGRNQELCLSLLVELSMSRALYTAACMGSDGIDGSSPAAGAVIDHSLPGKAEERGLDPREYLDRNDSYSFFREMGRAIITGYTGTNVNDFLVALIPQEGRDTDKNLGWHKPIHVEVD